ncbi:phage holin family protein [Phycicoccus sp. HDW14]|uniref:phage holin family protein n=1 Tax=Phycicoccus sp. HDW14 TaxID=2714941 RepID=UPI0014078FF8|nr:phage holin family protein [Phycicoccus sp. HDW14]QIM21879.1 phage holin family protein [Phycicoccus sp. HDW14]
MSHPDTDHHPPADASPGQLVAAASSQLSDLVRSEMALGRAELRASVRHAGLGAGLFGTAGLVALYGLGALVAAAVLGLATVLDAWLAALVVAVVLFAVAGVAGLVGRREASRTAPPLEHAVESVRTDVRAVAGARHGDTPDGGAR